MTEEKKKEGKEDENEQQQTSYYGFVKKGASWLTEPLSYSWAL